MNMMKKISAIALIMLMLLTLIVPACLAETADAGVETAQTETAADNSTGVKAVAAAVTIAVAAAAGAIAMGASICKAVEGIARQPEADGKIRTSLMLGLVFVETAIIYALIVAILIVFVL